MLDLRLGTFNTENLFDRVKVFVDVPDFGLADSLLGMVDALRDLLAQATYTDATKAQILDYYLTQKLDDYVFVREDIGKLWKYTSGGAIVGVAAGGSGDWEGSVVFKRSEFGDKARANTARVVKDIKADVLCVVEVENRDTLKAFDTHLLGSRYKYEMLIDANDPRGIDVGLYSKHPLGRMVTHMFDKVGNAPVFSRDCLEIEVLLPDGEPLYLLLNHLKSKGYDYDGKSDQKRKRQATRVHEILGQYQLDSQRVVVVGDFNDTPDSPQLQPLLDTQDLYDVLELQFGADISKRWTYHYRSFDQIDFLLVSRPLKDAFRSAGVIRRGLYGLHKLTSAPGSHVSEEREYDTVTRFSNQASDHGAVWASFKL
jgi:endonuclease/exonuclease/phosphatase family metal-dependent hydrolase